MRILTIASGDCLEGLSIFNPDNLPVKKVAVYKGWAIVINPKAQPYPDGRSNKIIINGVTYKLCFRCKQFLTLPHFRASIRKQFRDGLNKHCVECAKHLAALWYIKHREYCLRKSQEQQWRKQEKEWNEIGTDSQRDKRPIISKKPAAPKHWHPWSKRWSKTKNGTGNEPFVKGGKRL
jgi:hypothetical protein